MNIIEKSLIGEIQDYYNSYLNLGDGYLIDLVLATRISIDTDEPLWICIQGPSSSGKTEVLRMLNKDPECHFLYDLTGVSLFSGSNGARGGYIPREVGEKGLLVFPDFTTVMSKAKHILESIMSQLRVTFDGDASRITGMDTNRIEPWSGNVGVLLAVTDEIEKFKKRASSVGERFLYYRHFVPEFDLINYRPKSNDADIYYELNNLVTISQDIEPLEWTDEMQLRVNSAAQWIAMARSAVIRDTGTKDINYVSSPEEPYRINKQLRNLLNCLNKVHSGINGRTWAIFQEVVFSCVPSDRLEILHQIHYLSTDNSITQKSLQLSLQMGKSRLHYLIDDMYLQNLVSKEGDVIKLSEKFSNLLRQFYQAPRILFSKN